MTARKKRLRILFLSRGKLGRLVLTRLLKDTRVDVVGIFTCRHTPEVGESTEFFKQVASHRGIPFFQTNKINEDKWVKVVSRLEPDLGIAMIWVNTIGAEIIACAPLGFLNVHGGPLPRYRGNACSNWAILNGEKEQGITVHLMEPGKVDSGPILLQDRFPLTHTTSIATVMDHITKRGAEMILQAVELFLTGRAKPRAQDERKALTCYPRLPRDGEIDWSKPAGEIHTLIRASGTPYPGAYSFFSDVMDHRRIKKLTIDEASIGEHAGDFCAVPGHLIRFDQGKRWAIVCGDHRLLYLSRVRVDGVEVEPARYFRSVRQRLGLDTETLLRALGWGVPESTPVNRKSKPGRL